MSKFPTFPPGAVIEVIEKTDEPDPKCIIPNEIRINGEPVLAADEPVIVHEISTASNDLVRVTLTLYARRVTFATEPKGGE